MKNLSGVYEIKNIVNNSFYIGSAVNFKNRWKNHHSRLNRNVHYNSHLQNAWNKYGKDMFEFKILLVCDKKNNIMYEQTLIEKLDRGESMKILPNSSCESNRIYYGIRKMFREEFDIGEIVIRRKRHFRNEIAYPTVTVTRY